MYLSGWSLNGLSREVFRSVSSHRLGDNSDTLGWLDWLYVAEDPWAWSYTLQSWLYVPGAPEARGGWVFVAR